MSQEVQTELQAKTQGLLQGPLKHIRGAALAAALLPLASIAAAPASAQTVCSAGLSGFVWNDTNGDGIQNLGEPGLEGVKVYATVGADTLQTETDVFGFYFFNVCEPGTYPITVPPPQGMQPAPPNTGDDSMDSDGVRDKSGNSVATATFPNTRVTDFGFVTASVLNPGTGTPGYWKNHPEAWPVGTITVGAVNGVGGVTYTKAQAIIWLGKVGKDKTTTMFSSLVPAMLNVLIGNDPSCVSSAIDEGNKWMKAYGPVGSGVAGGSYAWSVGEPTHQQLDAYNNGLLCAPHRQ
jgi:SdrD B-like domain